MSQSQSVPALQERILPVNLHDYVARYRVQVNQGVMTVFSDAVKLSRKFGYPMICSMEGKTERERMVSAIRLLVTLAQIGQISEEDAHAIVLAYTERKTSCRLIEDARALMANGTANALTIKAFNMADIDKPKDTANDLNFTAG